MIEVALTQRVLKIVVSTTTLTEGVNLPVRTVVIAAQGYYAQGGEFEAVLDKFVSFVWFVTDASRTGVLPSVDDFIDSSLGWLQLDEQNRRRWGSVAASVEAVWATQDPDLRKRWALSGLSLGSARRIETVADTFATKLNAMPMDASFGEVADALIDDETLSDLAHLSEAPPTVLRPRSNAAREIDIPLVAATRDWIAGRSLNELALAYGDRIVDQAFRLEQVSELATELFENYLPWVLGVSLDWAAEKADRPLPETARFLPRAVRYGVNSEAAAELLRRGVQNRSLAVRVAAAYAASGATGAVRDWLSRLRLSDWSDLFEASPIGVLAPSGCRCRSPAPGRK
jgi:hypothetical protein